jgi:hypothetical protein
LPAGWRAAFERELGILIVCHRFFLSSLEGGKRVRKMQGQVREFCYYSTRPGGALARGIIGNNIIFFLYLRNSRPEPASAANNAR